MLDAPKSPQSLADALTGICTRYPHVDPALVAEMFRAVQDTLAGPLSARETMLVAEFEALGRIIAATRQVIGALQTDEVPAGQLVAANFELDAVVMHTAAATNTILDACETLDGAAGTLSSDSANMLQAATMRIYEACGFQDVTGQRISKVVNTLKLIEAKVNEVAGTFGGDTWEREPREPARNDVAHGDKAGDDKAGDADAGDATAAAEGAARDEAALMNGPQLPGMAMAQDDIDALLADF